VATQDSAFVRHFLQRFTFGPRPGDVERVQAQGVGPWLDAQLGGAGPDPAGDAALGPYASVLGSPTDLYDEVKAALGDDPLDELLGGKKPRKGMVIREIGGKLAMTALARHISSARQVNEVMVDFWTNHFNVFALKGPTGFVVADFVERVIRPHALGRFADLLAATAHHPAMLIYLDNWRSVADAAFQAAGRGARGINENYARELLELHTLGVDGGYSQADVVEAARILTGWSVEAPNKGSFGFLFRRRAHDWGDKTVLGRTYRAEGQPEGEKLLVALAAHPSTAKHLARKLCRRFVADDPPARLVEAVAESYLAHDGAVGPMLKTIAGSAEFAAAEVRGAKVKPPLRFVVSSVRALGGRADGTVALAGVMAKLGQPLFLDPIPTGYPDASAPWLNASALLARMNVAAAIAAERMPGVDADLDAVIPTSDDTAKLVDAVDAAILGGGASARTRDAIRAQAGALPNPEGKRALAVAMAIGSPDFQRS